MLTTFAQDIEFCIVFGIGAFVIITMLCIIANFLES